MYNITKEFQEIYMPFKGIVVYKKKNPDGSAFYVESFDFNLHRKPMNFHPLTATESAGLEKALAGSKAKTNFLHVQTMLPKTVLYVNSTRNGGAVWYSEGRKTPLFFKEDLDIPCGVGAIPPLLWKASRDVLHVFSLSSNRRPTWESPLFYAPFFNIAVDGKVCMGSVSVNISEQCSIESFITQWERYFFTSYFTHLLGSVSPVKGNIVQLWQSLIKKGGRFPLDKLLKTTYSLKDIIHDNL